MDKINKMKPETVTAEERAKLLQWKEEYSISAGSISQFLTNMESGEADLAGYSDYDAKKAWNAVSKNSGIKEDAKVIKPRFNWYSVAASVVILFLVGFGAQQFLFSGDQMYDQSFAAVEKINFPDGSLAQVDEGSAISYETSSFTQERALKLNGRAYFEVQSDERKSFTINTDKFNVQVLGTKFEVNTIDGFESVNVLEGKVRVFNQESEIFLTENERMTLTDGKFEIEKIAKQTNLLSWNKSTLVFNNAPISEMLSDISSHYNVNITLQGDNNLDCKHNTEFRKETLQSVLDEIALSFGATYEVSGKNITIQNIQCN